ncbi:MAG: SprT family zinc-dependent metalloprotease [Planctomycetota bacterium]
MAYSIVRASRTRTRLIVTPDGGVEVRTDRDRCGASIAKLVQSKAQWILRQQEYFERFRPRDPNRTYVSGETVRYLGRQYRLKIERGSESSVKLRGRFLIVRLPTRCHEGSERELVRGWYKSRASDVLAKRLMLCQTHAAPHGIHKPALTIRWMTRRWGSCTPGGRLILNPLVVLTPIDCVDYVLMHELCHLKHSAHNRAFYRLLDVVMPDWRLRRERLDRHGKHLAL